MSNQQADMRQHEQEMIANYQEFAEENIYLIDDLNNGYEIWKAATLAAEARIRDVCIKVADEIYTQIAISVTATKIPAIVDSVLDASLTEHKENQA